MLTPFGKSLRIFRLNRGELLKDMASKLDVTPAYLSSVENGKREPTQELMNRIYQNYDLSDDERDELETSMAKTVKIIRLQLNDEDDSELGLLFARKLNSLTDTQKISIAEILNRIN